MVCACLRVDRSSQIIFHTGCEDICGGGKKATSYQWQGGIIAFHAGADLQPVTFNNAQ